VNARDAMPNGGKLIIETQSCYLDGSYASTHSDVSPQSYVLIAVTNTGCGMPKETLEHIFEPFFTTKRKGKALAREPGPRTVRLLGSARANIRSPISSQLSARCGTA